MDVEVLLFLPEKQSVKRNGGLQNETSSGRVKELKNECIRKGTV